MVRSISRQFFQDHDDTMIQSRKRIKIDKGKGKAALNYVQVEDGLELAVSFINVFFHKEMERLVESVVERGICLERINTDPNFTRCHHLARTLLCAAFTARLSACLFQRLP